MISFFIVGAVGLTAMQAGIDGPRKAFVACLKEASITAEQQKIGAADYGAFILKRCEGQAGTLKSGLIGFDVKNGIKRAQASADAQAQLDDYVAMSSEKYESRMASSRPKSAPATAAATAPATTAAPAAIPASAPKY